MHGVGSDREQGDEIVPGGVGLSVASQACGLRGCDDGCFRDAGSGLIDDVAGETSSGLGMKDRRDCKHKNADKNEKYNFVEFLAG
jgi:hypothetical protein